MKAWPSKDPDEILRFSYDWGPDLAPGEVLDDLLLVDPVNAAGTNLDAQQFDDQFVTLVISGGNDNEEAEWLIRVHTSGDQTLEDTVALPISSKIVPVMHPGDYTVPTPENLIALYPEFARVARAHLQFYLNRAARIVDDGWPESDFGYARMLLAAHYLTAAGLGATAQAAAINDGSDQFRTMRIGSLALERFDNPGVKLRWDGTRYGREFKPLLRAIRGGPRVTGGLFMAGGDGDHFGPWTQ